MAASPYADVAVANGLDRARVATDVTLPLWNTAVRHQPALVARCRDTADVQAAVRTARALGVPLSVFSGGNDWEGRSVRDGGLVIDISAMSSIEVDVAPRTARIGGGVRSDALARAAHEHGLTPVTGTVGLVRIAELSLGGGYGPLGGRFGLACDNLVSAELVLADGTVVDVDADHDPDLLWAMRGGGGNFGVVTAAVVRLHPCAEVYTGMIHYPLAQARQVLPALSRLLDTSPDELSVQTIMMTGPDGRRSVAVMPTWIGDLAEAPARVAPLKHLGDPLSAKLGVTARHTILAEFATAFAGGPHVRVRTRNVAGFSPSVVDRLAEAADSWTSPLSVLSIHPFHGAATRIPIGSAAFGERRPHQMIEVIARWQPDDKIGAQDATRADRVHASLATDALPGGYVNLLSSQDDDQIRDAYGPNSGRLLEIKSRVDPHGIFRATPLPLTSHAPR